MSILVVLARVLFCGAVHGRVLPNEQFSAELAWINKLLLTLYYESIALVMKKVKPSYGRTGYLLYEECERC